MSPVHALALLASAGLLALPAPARAAVEATCTSGIGSATAAVDPARDAVLGPLVLLGGLRHGGARPNGFRRRGYKVPVTLPEGVRATLSVPPDMRGRVGLVFTLTAQDRAVARGVRGADTAVRFTACPAGATPGRSGWPGGLVIDRPRCVALVVTVAGEAPVRRRLPLGRRCR